MTQHGPRDLTNVIACRYWLTPKGYAATEPPAPGVTDEQESDDE